MVNKKSFSAVLATLVILSVIAGTSITSAQTAVVVGPQKTIVMTAEDTPTLSDLVKYLNATNLTAALNNTTKNYTVFAPDNAAFEKLGTTKLADLANNTTKLTTILKSHVIDHKVNLTTSGNATTLAGNEISWTVNGTKVQLQGGTNAIIVTKNITTSNGVVNVIDTVLQPGAGTTTRPVASAVASAAASAAGGFLGLPGFEALYAVAGLLAVAYLVIRRRK
ncbi:MAG: fasciclin domain-containing protein [Halobacteriota archaeon]